MIVGALVVFAGMALFSLVFLLRISVLLTGTALLFIAAFSLSLNRAFRHIRPIFRERAKITGEVSGRLTESLAGVRVVKGYHGEAEEGDSQTTAGPSKVQMDSSTPAVFTTQPSTARLPLSTARPPSLE